MCWWPEKQDFWPTIKPFLTNKGCNFETDIILNEDDKLLNDQSRDIKCFQQFLCKCCKGYRERFNTYK